MEEGVDRTVHQSTGTREELEVRWLMDCKCAHLCLCTWGQLCFCLCVPQHMYPWPLIWRGNSHPGKTLNVSDSSLPVRTGPLWYSFYLVPCLKFWLWKSKVITRNSLEPSPPHTLRVFSDPLTSHSVGLPWSFFSWIWWTFPGLVPMKLLDSEQCTFCFLVSGLTGCSSF